MDATPSLITRVWCMNSYSLHSFHCDETRATGKHAQGYCIPFRSSLLYSGHSNNKRVY